MIIIIKDFAFVCLDGVSIFVEALMRHEVVILVKNELSSRSLLSLLVFSCCMLPLLHSVDSSSPMIVLCAVGNQDFTPLIDSMFRIATVLIFSDFVDTLQEKAEVQYDLIAPIYPNLLYVNETQTLLYEPAEIVNSGANNTLKVSMKQAQRDD